MSAQQKVLRMTEKGVERFLAGLINIKIQPARLSGFPPSYHVSLGGRGVLH